MLVCVFFGVFGGFVFVILWLGLMASDLSVLGNAKVCTLSYFCGTLMLLINLIQNDGNRVITPFCKAAVR